MARRPPPHHAAPRSRTRRRNQRRLSCRRLGRRRLSTPPSTHSSAPNGKRQLKSRQSAPLERMTRRIHNSVQASLSHPFFPYVTHPILSHPILPICHTHPSHYDHRSYISPDSLCRLRAAIAASLAEQEKGASDEEASLRKKHFFGLFLNVAHPFLPYLTN